ncbi:type II secretion system F family protein [Hydrogenophaga sp. PBL-H3]|uniref:type II secretion system F family protein n=1 Tax=Hydrogenophaga sp. PBL-H3 TaxID=434010 RepID=UPI00131F5495|nr:type II secretion system F family protein [Hydrogenophaga sp. PBL-H3]QHE76513.1 type II secretion system F family protein [Hydrogenophaga sp. PBL-H3]QHE80937.1 type II secretion system F family protein [Hydrogenophaga sp. PBL-H3]
MNTSFALFVVLGFVAVVLLLEGLYVYWNDTKSPEVRRVGDRLRAISAGGQTEAGELKLLKQRLLSESPGFQNLLLRLPRARQLDQLMQQAGDANTVSHLLAISAMFGLAGLLVSLVLRFPWYTALAITLGLTALPLLNLVRKRNARLHKIEAQLPDAMDLMSRALRAGHAFPSSMAMVGSEAVDPIAAEFRITSDEIAFGVSVDAALNNLAARVPSPDMSYFVMAVIIQRETGGNLSELLGKLAELVRERFKLFAKVRALAAEGKLSAWILTGLPFCVAGAINILNPKYLSVLFTDPAGINVVYVALVMMALGIFFMWRIIDIKV